MAVGSLGTHVANRDGLSAEAEALSVRAIALWEELIRAEPHVARHNFRVSTVRRGLARRYALAGRPPEAEATYRAAITGYEKAVAIDPKYPGNQQYLAGALCDLARLDIAAQHFDRAEPSITRALKYFEKFDGPNAHPDHRSDLAHDLTVRAQFEEARGRTDRAEADHAAARELRADLVRRHPVNRTFRTLLAESCEALSRLHAAADRPSEAEAAWRESAALREQLAKDSPGDAARAADWADACLRLANLTLGQPAVRDWARKAVEALGPWAGALAKDPRLKPLWQSANDLLAAGG